RSGRLAAHSQAAQSRKRTWRRRCRGRGRGTAGRSAQFFGEQTFDAAPSILRGFRIVGAALVAEEAVAGIIIYYDLVAHVGLIDRRLNRRHLILRNHLILFAEQAQDLPFDFAGLLDGRLARGAEGRDATTIE